MKPSKDEIAIAFKTMEDGKIEEYEGTLEIKYSMCDLFQAYDQRILTMRMMGVLGACYFYRHPERQDEDVKHHLNLLHKSDQFTIMHFAAYCSGRYRRNPGEPDVEPHDVTKEPQQEPQVASVGKPEVNGKPKSAGKPVNGKPRPESFHTEPTPEQLGLSKETTGAYLESLTEEMKKQQEDPHGTRYQNEPPSEAPKEPEFEPTATRPRQAPIPPTIAARENGKPKRRRKREPVRPPDPTRRTPLVGKRLKEVEIELDNPKPGQLFEEKLSSFDQG
jgi:hypothetical protein